jgi:hypothetical protein
MEKESDIDYKQRHKNYMTSRGQVIPFIIPKNIIEDAFKPKCYFLLQSVSLKFSFFLAKCEPECISKTAGVSYIIHLYLKMKFLYQNIIIFRADEKYSDGISVFAVATVYTSNSGCGDYGEDKQKMSRTGSMEYNPLVHFYSMHSAFLRRSTK